MSDLITYDDKIRLKSQNVSEKYKVTAGDMNEIKSVVNTNVELVDEINKPDNWISVGKNAPTDGRRVWFKKSKNLFNKNDVNVLNAYFSSSQTTIAESVANRTIYVPCRPNTTYTMRKISSSQFTVGYTKDLPTIGTQVYAINNTQTTIETIYGYITITTGDDAKYIVSRMYQTAQDTSITFDEVCATIQIEEGSTATSYEPYNREINVDDEQWLNKTNLVSVGATSPTGGERVWFNVSNNIFNKDGHLDTITTVVQGGATTAKTANKITITTASNNNSGFSISGANFSTYIDNLDTSKNYYISMDIKASRNIEVQMGVVARPKFAVTTQTQRIQTATIINGTAGFEVWSTAQTANDTIEVSNIMISTNPEISYEPYVEKGLYVDEEEWYNLKKMDDIETRIATRVSYLLSTTIGWKRIARMSGMSGGTMMLSNTASYGTLGEFDFTYASGYGNTFTKIFKIITNGHYFNKARIVSKGNAEGYLELYQQVEYSRTLTLVLSPLSQGVILYTQETEGSIPDGYTATEYTFT